MSVGSSAFKARQKRLRVTNAKYVKDCPWRHLILSNSIGQGQDQHVQGKAAAFNPNPEVLSYYEVYQKMAESTPGGGKLSAPSSAHPRPRFPSGFEKGSPIVGHLLDQLRANMMRDALSNFISLQRQPVSRIRQPASSHECKQHYRL